MIKSHFDCFLFFSLLKSVSFMVNVFMFLILYDKKNNTSVVPLINKCFALVLMSNILGLIFCSFILLIMNSDKIILVCEMVHPCLIL